VIADEPAQLLAAAAIAAQNGTAQPPEARTDPLSRRVAALHAARELAWDTTARATHELRITLREKGARMVAGDLAAAGDDVFYLTCDELVTNRPDVRALVRRRRAEQQRLEQMGPPDVFQVDWRPVAEEVAHAEPAPAPEPLPWSAGQTPANGSFGSASLSAST